MIIWGLFRLSMGAVRPAAFRCLFLLLLSLSDAIRCGQTVNFRLSSPASDGLLEVPIFPVSEAPDEVRAQHRTASRFGGAPFRLLSRVFRVPQESEDVMHVLLGFGSDQSS